MNGQQVEFILHKMRSIWSNSFPKEPPVIKEYTNYFLHYEIKQIESAIEALKLIKNFFPTLAEVHDQVQSRKEIKNSNPFEQKKCKYCNDSGYYMIKHEVCAYKKDQTFLLEFAYRCCCETGQAMEKGTPSITDIATKDFLDKVGFDQIIVKVGFNLVIRDVKTINADIIELKKILKRIVGQ